VRRALAAALLVTALAAACGDDGGGGDDDLVELLRTEAGQSESVAGCVAERLEGDEAVDRDELEAIVRGEGSGDVETADAYSAAAAACAED
jgi:hypothetical protein